MHKRKALIGLAGRAGSGKDSAAAFLASYGFKRIAFAEPIKDMLAVIGMPEPADRALKEFPIQGFGFTWRHAAQSLGTEWGRKCLDSDLWLKLTLRRAALLPLCVISDVRFENEAAAIREAGGLIVHMQGRGVELLGGTAAHASEAGLSVLPEDEVIDNSGSMHYLGMQVVELLNKHMEE